MALIHVFLETLNLVFEARTWKTHFRDYIIACHNAKQGWIAQSMAITETDENKKSELNNNITFDDKVEMFCR